jgi:hypothetical protein
MLKSLSEIIFIVLIFCTTISAQHGYVCYQLDSKREAPVNYSYFLKKHSLYQLLADDFLKNKSTHTLTMKDTILSKTHEELQAFLKTNQDFIGLSFDKTFVIYSFDLVENKIIHLKYYGAGISIKSSYGVDDEKEMILSVSEEQLINISQYYNDAVWYNPFNTKEFLNFNEALKSEKWDGDYYAMIFKDKLFTGMDSSANLPKISPEGQLSLMANKITDTINPITPDLWKQDLYVSYDFSLNYKNYYWKDLPVKEKNEKKYDSTSLYRFVKKAIFEEKLSAYLIRENYYTSNHKKLNWSEIKDRTSWRFNFHIYDPDDLQYNYNNPDSYTDPESTFEKIRITYRLKTDPKGSKAEFIPQWISFLVPERSIEDPDENYEMFSVKYQDLINYIRRDSIKIGKANDFNHHIIYDPEFLISNRFIDTENIEYGISMPFYNSMVSDYSKEYARRIFDSTSASKLFELIKPNNSIITTDSLYSYSSLQPAVYEFEYILAFEMPHRDSKKRNALDSLTFYIIKNKYLKNDLKYLEMFLMTREELAIMSLNIESLDSSATLVTKISGSYSYTLNDSGINKVFIPESLITIIKNTSGEIFSIGIADIDGFMKADKRIDQYIRTIFKNTTTLNSYSLSDRRRSRDKEIPLPFPLDQKYLFEEMKIKFE